MKVAAEKCLKIEIEIFSILLVRVHCFNQKQDDAWLQSPLRTFNGAVLEKIDLVKVKTNCSYDFIIS